MVWHHERHLAYENTAVAQGYIWDLYKENPTNPKTDKYFGLTVSVGA